MFKNEDYAKGSFYSESAIRFSNLQKKNIPNYYPELEIWICCLLLVIGGKFKFQANNSKQQIQISSPG